MFCDHSKDVETTRNNWGAHRWNTRRNSQDHSAIFWRVSDSQNDVNVVVLSQPAKPSIQTLWEHCSPWCSSADRWCQKFSCKFNKFSLEATNVHQMNWSERAAAGGARTRLKAEARSPECFFLSMSSFHTQKIQRATSSRAAEKLPNKMNLFKAIKCSSCSAVRRNTELVESLMSGHDWRNIVVSLWQSIHSPPSPPSKSD